MIARIDRVAVWAILVLTLASSVVLGLITPYVLAAIGVILLVSRVADGTWRRALAPAPLLLLGVAHLVAVIGCFAGLLDGFS